MVEQSTIGIATLDESVPPLPNWPLSGITNILEKIEPGSVLEYLLLVATFSIVFVPAAISFVIGWVKR
jgi:hypothetical protein